MLPTNHHHRATRRNFWFQKNLFAQTTKRKSNRSTKFTKRKSHNLFEIFYSIHRTRLTLYSMIERYLQFVRAKCAKIQITLQSRSNSSSSVRPRFGPPRARIVMYSYTNLQKWNEHQSVKLYSHFVQCRDMYLVNVRRGWRNSRMLRYAIDKRCTNLCRPNPKSTFSCTSAQSLQLGGGGGGTPSGSPCIWFGMPILPGGGGGGAAGLKPGPGGGGGGAPGMPCCTGCCHGGMLPGGGGGTGPTGGGCCHGGGTPPPGGGGGGAPYPPAKTIQTPVNIMKSEVLKHCTRE